MTYPSELTDEQWDLLEPVFNARSKRGRKHADDLRNVARGRTRGERPRPYCALLSQASGHLIVDVTACTPTKRCQRVWAMWPEPWHLGLNPSQELRGCVHWTASRQGERAGKPGQLGFPRFKSRHKTPLTFRLRAKYREGATPSVRPTGPKTIRFPKLDELPLRESTLRRMLSSGRFHAYAASFRFERGRWVVALTGVAAPFHHQRRGHTGRYPARVGVDLGVKTLAVVADETGRVLHAWVGVRALQPAQARLRLANQRYSRTKRDSKNHRPLGPAGQGKPVSPE